MFAQATMDGVFDFLPSLGFKKIWSLFKVEQPARPAVEGRPTAWIRSEGDRFPEAAVYEMPDGKWFYVPYEIEGNRLCANMAQQMLSPSSSLSVVREEGNVHFPNEVGPLGNKADPNVQRWLLTAYYGRKDAARHIRENSL